MTTLVDRIDISIISDEEMQAQNLLKRGEIDQALAIYQRLKFDSARVPTIIGLLYSENKGDYESAIKYYTQALQIQEKNGEDTSNTLTELGIIYQNTHQFDLALTYHLRALSIRKLAHCIDQKLIASNFIGIANAYWGQQSLSEALNYAQQALTLNKSIESPNELNIAVNLAILANIYYNSGDAACALKLATQALILLERCVPSDSPALASLLNNIGAIQVVAGLFADAQQSFVRVLQICERTFPEGHPRRVAMEINIQRITAMELRNPRHFDFPHWEFLLKTLLL